MKPYRFDGTRRSRTSGKKGSFLIVDVGSVSINVVAVNDKNDVVKIYMRTEGKLFRSLRKPWAHVITAADVKINGVGTTGSGKASGAAVLGADVVKA